MSFKSESRLQSLITRALKDPEIIKGLREASISSEMLAEKIFNDERDFIWAVAIDEIQKYDGAEAELHQDKEFFDNYEFADKYVRQVREGLPYLASGTIAFSFIAALVYLGMIVYKNYTWLTASTLRIILSIFGLLIVLSIAINIGEWLLDAVKKRRTLRLHQKFIKMYVGEKRVSNLMKLKGELQIQETSITTKLIEKIRESARYYINGYLEPSYSSQLEFTEAPGLAEVTDPTKAINTSARKELEFLLTNMPGGSIGIAGPRGAGKSTLIQIYCGAKRTVETLKGKKILPVMSAAPVQYNGREFILHLFSMACKSYLKSENAVEKSLGFSEIDTDISVERERKMNKLFIRVLKVLLPVSGVLLVAGLSIALALTQYFPDKDGNMPANTPAIVKFIKILNLDAGALILWGLIGFIGSAILLRRYEVVLGNIFGKLFRKAEDLVENLQKPQGKSPVEQAKDVLIGQAQLWLKRIKFQQSFTNGWSGGVKFPLGIEGGMSRAYNFSENQLSNPEIIEGFTQFLRDVSEYYLVIIGIDEMDRIETDERAREFLNEIKSIFGLPKCFYLISVSENAMTNFERRGLPFRDVFDSSFDNIIYVDYLTLENGRELLERRVIGKPLPFFYLSYCLSGGLPRDLIRSFRSIIHLTQQKGSAVTLEEITTQLLEREFRAKIRATLFSAKKAQQLKEADNFFASLSNLQGVPLTSNSVKPSLEILKKWKDALPANIADQNGDKLSYQLLQDLCDEVSAFVYFVDTVLQIFTKRFTLQEIKELEGSGNLQKIAHARQALSLDTTVAAGLINVVRDTYRMEKYYQSAG